MASLSEVYGISGVTISTTEISIISGNSTLQSIAIPGIYELWLDPVQSAVADGDEFEWKVYEKIRSTATKRVAYSGTLIHEQSEIIIIPDLKLFHGFDFTLKKLAGTDRSWWASVRAVLP